jgi:thioredoxin-like negative regulator of GroEL
MKKEFEKRQEFLGMGHGEITLVDQDDFLPKVTKSKYVVCHFFHPEFQRCKIMDRHLANVAKKYIATRFIRINADKSPFFVQKLAIRVLPTVVLFKDGVAVDRIVGFEELGGNDKFKQIMLEKRIAQQGIIVVKDAPSKPKLPSSAIRQGVFDDLSDDGHSDSEDEDEDDD